MRINSPMKGGARRLSKSFQPSKDAYAVVKEGESSKMLGEKSPAMKRLKRANSDPEAAAAAANAKVTGAVATSKVVPGAPRGSVRATSNIRSRPSSRVAPVKNPFGGILSKHAGPLRMVKSNDEDEDDSDAEEREYRQRKEAQLAIEKQAAIDKMAADDDTMEINIPIPQLSAAILDEKTKTTRRRSEGITKATGLSVTAKVREREGREGRGGAHARCTLEERYLVVSNNLLRSFPYLLSNHFRRRPPHPPRLSSPRRTGNSTTS